MNETIPRLTARRRRLLKWSLGSLAAVLVIGGLLLGTFGIVVSRVPEYRVQLQDWINERSGLVVEFRTISARLRFFGPELVFDQAVVRTPDRTQVLAVARRGSVGFDIWNAIRTGRLTAGRFRLDSPQISLIRTHEGRIQLLGQSALPENADRPFALENLPTGQFDVRHAVVSFRDEITGRGPWSLSGVTFELSRDPRSLRLRGDASLPQALGRTLEFSATAAGALEEPATLVSTFTLGGEDLDVAGWVDLLPDHWPVPETGRGALRLRGALNGAALTQLSVEADFSGLTAVPTWTLPLPGAELMEPPVAEPDAEEAQPAAEPVVAVVEASAPQAQPEAEEIEPIAPPPAQPLLSYDRLKVHLEAQRSGDEWRSTLSDIELRSGERVWQADRVLANWSRQPDGHVKLSGKADRIELEPLWPLLAYLPENEAMARLRALSATGTIEDLSLEFERKSPEAAPTYSVEAKLDAIGWQPIARVPGVSGLGGTVRGTDAGGRAHLAARDVQFLLPRIFRQALDAKAVDGDVQWTRDAQGLHIGADEIRVDTDDGGGTAQFTALVPADGSSPIVKINARGQDLNVASTWRYIPVGRMGPRTVEWFDRAFIAGRVTKAEFVYDGPTRSFPFRGGEGTFLVRGQVEGATLQYQPDWAPATEIAAEVEFRNAGMQIRSTAATVGNLHLSEARASIADLKETRIVIKAAAAGGLHDALEFLKASPLGPRLGDQFARLDGQGALQANVSLDLPLRRIRDRQIEVTTRLADAVVSLQGIATPVRGVQGTLTVRNSLLSQADLHGTWSGGPIDATIEPRPGPASLLSVRGHAEAAQLQSMFKLPAAVRLSGATRWHMSTMLTEPEGESAVSRTVRIDSDLDGLGIGLPSPLGKTEQGAVPMQLALEFDRNEWLLARGSLGAVRSLMKVRRDGTEWALDRGTVRADGVAPALADHRGLHIEGTIDRFVLDEWLALRPPPGSGNGTGKPLSDFLQAANVRIGEFGLFGYRWPDVRGMLQSTSSGWRVDVSGPNAVGQVLIPESFTGSQALRATLERLTLDKAASEASPGSSTAGDPRNLPNLEVYVADLRLGPRRLGAIELKATRVPQGIRVDNVTVIGEAVRADAHGEWLSTTDGPHSSLEATIESTDVAATLRALNSTEFMQAKLGRIHANLSWPGGFDSDLLAQASGAISVDAETGQIVNVQPGAGRMLGLFSVAALPRRLALDFSDLTDKGLAFDTVHGDFELRAGNAYTSNLTLRGPAAEIGIAGRTGLGTRDYDQTAVVTGNLGASLPVAGALAGGPAVGAALLLFSQIFKEPLKGITRGYYRITGPWDDPVVERVDASEVKAENAGQNPGASLP